MIAKRRIGHTPVQIKLFILNTDLDGLLPEHCELLLKFIPAEEEVRNKKRPLCCKHCSLNCHSTVIVGNDHT